MTAHELLTDAAAFLLGVIAIARATRLVTADDWPPIAWVRDRWELATAYRDGEGKPLRDNRGDLVPGPWTKLLTCPFCFAPYPTAVALAAAIWADIWTPDLTTFGGWWWTFAVWAAASYLAAMLVVRDEPAD